MKAVELALYLLYIETCMTLRFEQALIIPDPLPSLRDIIMKCEIMSDRFTEGSQETIKLDVLPSESNFPPTDDMIQE